MSVELRHVAADESFAQLGVNRFRDVGEFGGAGGLMAYGANGRVVLLHQRPEVRQDSFKARLARESPLFGKTQAEIHDSYFRLFFAWRARAQIGFGFALLCKGLE